MPARRLAAIGLLINIVIFSGCTSRKPAPEPPVAPPATEQTLAMVRQQYQAQDPSARVGIVTAVMRDANLAEVKGIDPRECRENEPITFIDTYQDVLTNGTIVWVNPDSLHVRFESPHGGIHQR